MDDKINKIPTTITTTIFIIKGFAKYLLIPTGVIMFAPDEWLLHFHLINIKNSYGVWVAIFFWISLSIIIINWIEFYLKKIVKVYQQKQITKIMEKSLDTLNPEEWDIIYRINKYNSYNYDLTQASVAKLTAQNIITRPNMGTLYKFSYTLQPWVRTYLDKNPKIIKLFAIERKQALEKMICNFEHQLKNDYFKQWEIQKKIDVLREELEHYV